MRILTAFAALLLAAYGCAPAETDYPVTGAVTYDGKPVPLGQIYFDPDVMKGGKGKMGFAKIIDGKFDTGKDGAGMRGGFFVVRVQGFDGSPKSELPFGNSLFPEYEMKMELPKDKAEIQIDVPKKK